MKQWFVTAVLALTAMGAWAAPVDAGSALAAAQRFVQSSQSGCKLAPAAGTLRLAYAQPSSVAPDLVDYYVFNASDDDGFVVVAGDDRAGDVLAFGESAIDMDNLPCNARWWFNLNAKQMEYLHSHPDLAVQRQPKAPYVIIDPLLSSRWSQGAPYYNMCPVYQGHYVVTGCVATAMAQVMYYWKFPAELPDLISYVTPSLGLFLPDLPPVTLDWNGMLDEYSGYYSPDQGNAVATLMRYCGQSCYMDYNVDGSGADCRNQWIALQMFGYNPASSIIYRDYYSVEQWDSIMRQDMIEGHPILYAGFDEDSGHAFVVDGLLVGLYHINWGWGGNADGHFILDDFLGFTGGQQMIRQLYPEGYGQPVTPYDAVVDGVCYKIDGDAAAVTYRTEVFGSYSGEVVVPARVNIGGSDYAVTAVANNAFRGSETLTRVTLPSTIKTIGKYAFKDCKNLKGVNIPSSVTTIDYGAFMGCTSLDNVQFSNGLREIGIYAFQGCSALSRAILPGSLRVLSEGAFNGSGVKRVSTGDGVETVGNGAFARCRRLNDAVVGNAVTLIGVSAFQNCSALKNLTIGPNVEYIAEHAFYGCSTLASVKAMPEFVPLVEDPDCFSYYAYNNGTLYVPEGVEDDYMLADVWYQFQNIVGIDMNTPPGDVNADGAVNIADVNAVISGILNGSDSTAVDVNGDGAVNIADVNAVISIILNQ